MPILTQLKRLLTELKRLLTELKLSPTLPFTRYFFTLLKLTTLVRRHNMCLGGLWYGAFSSLTLIPRQHATPLRI